MAAQVSVLAGPARSGKTSAALKRFRQALAKQTADGPVGHTLWMAPTQRAADEIRWQLLNAGALNGCFSPGIYTFGQFADSVLAQSEEALRPLGRLLKRQLIERVLAEANKAERLPHFGPIVETAGLVDLVAGLISDLKRQGIAAKRFVDLIEAVGSSPKNQELAGLYAEYERLLSNNLLYDAEERFLLAREMLRKGVLGPFANVKLAVVDGFTDFTHTQQEILQLLAERAPALEQLLITLPLEQEPGRGELFLKPQQTLAELQKRHHGLRLEWQARAANAAWPAIAQLERRLFCNPRELAADLAADGRSPGGAKVEIVAASGQSAEVELLGRRIKRLLALGDEADGNRPVRPQDVAVVFRSLEASAALVQEVFDEFGIPVAVESSAKLIRSPLLQALVGLLRLSADDWPFRQLLSVLSNNYFQPEWPEWRSGQSLAAAEWAVRQLQVPRGRTELRSALEWRSKAESPADPGSDDAPLDEGEIARQQERRERYRTAWSLLKRLEKALDTVNHSRPLAKWTAALQELVDEFGLLRVAQRGSDSVSNRGRSASQFDEAAWDALKSAIGASDQLQRRLKIDAQKFSVQQFVKWLLDVLSTEPLPVDSDDAGRVRVLSAQSIRALEVPYLFVAGLSEKSFPPPARDDRIYSDAECRELNRAGLHFADHRQRGSEEMLLFYETITRATRRLVLSYPALDEKAQPLLASPYLLELARCAPGQIEHKQEISLSPVPRHEQPCSPAQERVQAVAELVAGKPHRLAGMLRDSQRGAGANIVAGLRATAARRRAEFGAFDGLLTAEAAKARLTQHYGPEHCWSVSRLEEYASCPYRFFLRNVLRLEELPELALDIDYGSRGSLAHEALRELHRRLNAAGAYRSPADDGAKKFSELSDETFAILVEKYSAGSPLDRALRTIDLRLLVEWIQGYFGQHEKYDAAGSELDKPLRPAHFEVSFGLKRRDKENKDALSTEQPFDLDCGEETIRFSGQIDRIDIGLAGGEVVFNILDYKTGRKKKLSEADLAAGLALQLPIYALAVQELLMIDRRAKPWRVGYWYLKEKGFESEGLPQCFSGSDEGLLETDAWRELRGKLLGRVVTLVRSVRGGMFPVYSLDEECTSRCAYNTVCRIGQVRALEKQWPAAGSVNEPAETKVP